MTTTPPPMPEPIAWHEYARKKPAVKRLVFDRTSRKDLRVAGWVSEALIEAASVEARDAQWMERITALEAEIAAMKPDADELRFLNGDLLYWVDRAVGKGNANCDIEEAFARYEEWCAARTALENTK